MKIEKQEIQAKQLEEETARQRDKTLLMQKENKIKVLEAKLGDKSNGGAAVKIIDSAQQNKN